MRNSYDYAVIRIVPRVDREEFVNAGVIVFCRVQKYLKAHITLNKEKIQLLAPNADLEEIDRHLALVPLICEGATDGGPISRLDQHERFHWLVAPRSTIIQTGPCHSGLTDDPDATLKRLYERLVG